MAGHHAKVLGIHQSGPLSSAALVVDGQVVAGAAEERFTRRKYDNSFPWNAANFCLDEGRLALADLDAVAIGWNPGANAALKYQAGFSDWMRYPGEWLASVPNAILPRMGKEIAATSSRFLADGAETRIEFIDHHRAHARLALRHSGFSQAAILVADGWSEQRVTSLWRARDGALDLLGDVLFPNSIGCFYAAMTEFLGYRPMSDEWRVMGMAAFGQAGRVPDLGRLMGLGADGGYALDLAYFDFYAFDRQGFIFPRLEELLGPARRPGEALTQRHFDIAAATQEVFATVMDHVLEDLHRRSGCQDLCLSGGVAMNCLYNGAVTRRTPFRRCSVSFAPDDSGNSIGAALEMSLALGASGDGRPLMSAMGPTFTDDAIGELLERCRLRYRRVDDIGEATARLLAEGKVVAWFQGRSEFGQRALGHRSILASPLRADMKDRLNASVKYRESYRPFAPMLPIKYVNDFFEDGEDVPNMEKALYFRPDQRAKVPAVVHADGTGRLQTVAESQEPLLHRLLASFEQLTGTPVLVNTSFNLNGEPIVGCPDDALRTFVTSGLDALAIGGFLLEKGKL